MTLNDRVARLSGDGRVVARRGPNRSAAPPASAPVCDLSDRRERPEGFRLLGRALPSQRWHPARTGELAGQSRAAWHPGILWHHLQLPLQPENDRGRSGSEWSGSCSHKQPRCCCDEVDARHVAGGSARGRGPVERARRATCGCRRGRLGASAVGAWKIASRPAAEDGRLAQGIARCADQTGAQGPAHDDPGAPRSLESDRARIPAFVISRLAVAAGGSCPIRSAAASASHYIAAAGAHSSM